MEATDEEVLGVGRAATVVDVKRGNLSQLYLMAPGAGTAGSGTYDNIRFNGRSNQENAIRIDGVEASSLIDQSPGNLNGEISSGFRLQSSLETVQEFRVDSSTYPAELGTGTGGQINVVSTPVLQSPLVWCAPIAPPMAAASRTPATLSPSLNARSGLPLDIRITRPDVVYVDQRDGKVYSAPVLVGGAPVTVATMNVPGGGNKACSAGSPPPQASVF